MNRKLKNILMVIVLCILFVTSFITFKLYNSNSSINNDIKTMDIRNMQKRDNMDPEMMAPPDMQEDGSDIMTPPELSDENKENIPPSDNSANGGMKQKRQKNTEQSSANSTNLSNDENSFEIELIKNNVLDGNNEVPNNMQMKNMEIKQTNTNVMYYILFGVQGLFISLISVYLIMSKLNEKSFSETLKNTEKLIIYSLGTVILTTLIVFILINI